MRTRLFAAGLLLLHLAAAGCGASSEGRADAVAPPNAPDASAASPAPASPRRDAAAHEGAAADSSVADIAALDAESPSAALTSSLTDAPAPAAPTPTPPLPSPPAPTAEQLARWTPPPFDPLQLLAVREWDKTSFTAQLAAAPDGRHFITAGSRVLLWSLGDDKPVHVFLDLAADSHERNLQALAVSPDGTWFAVGDSEGMLRIWNLAERTEAVSKQLYPTGIQHLAVSPDSREIATISYNSEVSIWSADKLELKHKFQVSARGVKRIAYASGDLLAAAGESTGLWNIRSGTKTHDLPDTRYASALARSADDAKLIFGGDEALRVWDVASAKLDSALILGVSRDALLAAAPDGKTLATSDGRSIDVWNLSDGRRLQSIPGFGATIVGISWLQSSNLLAAASEDGVTRMWGTQLIGAAIGLQPLHTPLGMPDEAGKAPATPEQLEQVINWRTFPTLPGSVGNVHTPTDLHSVVPADVAEARAFYRHFLTQAGWTELPADPHNPTSMSFQKDGFSISGSFYDSGDGKTNVTLHHAGAFDVRQIPKADAAAVEIVYEDANSSSYRARATLLDLETSLLRKLPADGWAAYARLNSSYSDEPDRRSLEFLRNGTTLRVSIGKFPDDTAETYTVQYALFPNSAWAPVPPDARFIEFDGSTEPNLIALTGMSLTEAQEFYDRELAAQGWLARTIGRGRTDEPPRQQWLPYLRGQCSFTVGLSELPDGRTLVRIGNPSDSLWAASQPQETETSGDEPPTDGLQAADFPRLNATRTAKYDFLGETIEVRHEGATLAEVAELYMKALGELGWQAETGGIRDEEYTFFDFTKDEQEISLRATRKDGAAVVSFEGDGLVWTKALPEPPRVVAYETWLRRNKLPASGEFLERYIAEMRSIPQS